MWNHFIIDFSDNNYKKQECIIIKSWLEFEVGENLGLTHPY